MSNNDLLKATIEGTDVSNYKCRTRMEHFLKKCACGEVCDDMTPRTRTEELLVEVSKKIAGGSGGELNIHYSSTTAPTDTSQLWVKADVNPSKVVLNNEKLSLVEAGDSNPTMENLGDILPKMAEAICCSVGTDIYVFGGRGSITYSSILKFDSITGTITTLETTLPTAICSTGCASVGTDIYIFGGLQGASGGLDTILKFDSNANILTTLETTLPTTIGACCCSAIGKNIYIFGGTIGDKASTKLDTIFKFNTDKNEITTLETKLPRAIGYLYCDLVGTDVYIFDPNTTEIFKFDSITGTITILEITLPKILGSACCSTVGNNIYIFGGRNSGVTLNTILKFDTIKNVITTLEVTMPGALSNICCSAVEGDIYLFGGYDKSFVTQKTIFHFKVNVSLFLNNNVLYLKNSLSLLKFKLFNTQTIDVNVSLEKCYLGNSENIAEVQTVAIHNGTEWQEI